MNNLPYAETISLDQYRGSNLLVESQLVITHKHDPSPRAKCTSTCNEKECVSYCPTKSHTHALVLVTNTTNKTQYVTPGLKIATLEEQYEHAALGKEVNKIAEEIVNSILIANGENNAKVASQSDHDLPQAAQPSTSTRENGARSKLTVQDKYKNNMKFLKQRDRNTVPLAKLESRISPPKFNLLSKFEQDKMKKIVKENEILVSNFLHLDPIKDSTAYNQQYQDKHQHKVRTKQKN